VPNHCTDFILRLSSFLPWIVAAGASAECGCQKQVRACSEAAARQLPSRVSIRGGAAGAAALVGAHSSAQRLLQLN